MLRCYKCFRWSRNPFDLLYLLLMLVRLTPSRRYWKPCESRQRQDLVVCCNLEFSQWVFCKYIANGRLFHRKPENYLARGVIYSLIGCFIDLCRGASSFFSHVLCSKLRLGLRNCVDFRMFRRFWSFLVASLTANC